MTEASRKSRQSEFKKKVHRVLLHCQEKKIDPKTLSINNVKKILDDAEINGGDIITDSFHWRLSITSIVTSESSLTLLGAKDFTVKPGRRREITFDSDRRCTVYCDECKGAYFFFE